MSGPARVFVASGHGADDPGAESSGVVERDLNVTVARMLVDRLADHGVDVATDLDHGNPTFPAEAELAHRIGDITYYLAVHHNWYESSAARGSEAFARPGPATVLAMALHRAQLDALRTLDPTIPDRGVKDPEPGGGSAKHLDAAPGTACVLEPCFISSPADRALCTGARYAPLLAEAWCRALIDHGRIDGAWDLTFTPSGPPLPPVFSVVVPTCDRGPLLAEAVESVLDQTVTGIEVLVVDDGQSGAAPTFDDPRVTVIPRPHTAPSGPAAARNRGLDAATGRYLAFLDDDDRWTPDRLDLALDGLSRAPVAVCRTRHQGGDPGRFRPLEGRVGSTLLADTTPCLGATAVERAVAPRFDERWFGIEDVVWWWELARSQPVTSTDRVGYLVGLHDGPRVHNTVEVRVRENREFLREHEASAWRTAAIAAVRYLLAHRRVPNLVKAWLDPVRRALRPERSR